MQEPFSIEFANGLTATAIYPPADADLSAILERLGQSPTPSSLRV